MVTTQEILDLVLEMDGLTELPADSGIAVEGSNIKKVLMGVDMDTPEILAAKQLGYDLVISHHPKTGSMQIDFNKVMLRQIDKMVEFGVPINRAQKALAGTMAKIERSGHPGNYDRVKSFAELIGMPFMNIHMPCDILGENFVQNLLNEKFGDKPRTKLQDIIDCLNTLPEYQNSIAKPKIRVGSPSDYAGKIAVLFAGGTNGGEQVFKSYFDAGVGTIVCMHVPDNVRDAVISQNIGNVIVAGHMPSDSIGINLFINELEKKGVEVKAMSGIVR